MSGRIGAVNTEGRGIVSFNRSPSAEATDTVGLVAIVVMLSLFTQYVESDDLR